MAKKIKFPFFFTTSLGLSSILLINATGKLSIWGAKKQNITLGLDPVTTKRYITYLRYMIPLVFSYSGITVKKKSTVSSIPPISFQGSAV